MRCSRIKRHFWLLTPLSFRLRLFKSIRVSLLNKTTYSRTTRVGTAKCFKALPFTQMTRIPGSTIERLNYNLNVIFDFFVWHLKKLLNLVVNYRHRKDKLTKTHFYLFNEPWLFFWIKMNRMETEIQMVLLWWKLRGETGQRTENEGNHFK